ncbi:MAG: GNAT family N-acetyltransferase [Psychroserpens sp.]|uniref:GNAT family N-acetyltransferase n=1 Tax=Psychroserpens sp. TaxID=2020870 RepID=UPI003C728676
MSFQFKLVVSSEIQNIIPLIQKLTNNKFSDQLLLERFTEMTTQNYECAAVFDGDIMIGVTGLWFSTRHYAGKTVEIDHVYIEEAYRNKGLGKQFLSWIYNYAKTKGCLTAELNTYVQNYPSHKLYYNEGFEILGYHFLKTL